MHTHDGRLATWCCRLALCSSRFITVESLRAHQGIPDIPSHHPVWDDLAITCAECNEIFSSAEQLREHAKGRKHSPYVCSCGVNFARNDVLRRHIASYLKENAKYPCTFCRRHRGKQAFRRKDHLVQHLQGYHKMDPEEITDALPPSNRAKGKSFYIPTCPHVGCEAYRDFAFNFLPSFEQLDQRPFGKQSDYYKHMRDVHKESTFPCRVAHCDRVGAKGYMREKDLMKHITAKHPEAPQYIPSEPRTH
ncbi:hypothetical protein F4825DRAFT_416896 [Nemania diffusa]|nr:hypothetical protein F4825DRAFT_416896 [Nemania diffusa]